MDIRIERCLESMSVEAKARLAAQILNETDDFSIATAEVFFATLCENVYEELRSRASGLPPRE